MDWSIKVTDLAIVFATAIGPILAIQIQKIIERRQEKRQLQLSIFKTLMSTRVSRMSERHVDALNMIPIEFYGQKYIRILNAWKTYINHLSPNETDAETWGNKSNELYITLVKELASNLGYSFYDEELKKEIYSPMLYHNIQSDNEDIRTGVAKILRGERSLPMEVTSFPVDNDLLEIQKKIQSEVLEIVKSRRTPESK